MEPAASPPREPMATGAIAPALVGGRATGEGPNANAEGPYEPEAVVELSTRGLQRAALQDGERVAFQDVATGRLYRLARAGFELQVADPAVPLSDPATHLTLHRKVRRRSCGGSRYFRCCSFSRAPCWLPLTYPRCAALCNLLPHCREMMASWASQRVRPAASTCRCASGHHGVSSSTATSWEFGSSSR
eukprot:scaffold820_cov376-Prasinococcus_capsulatus_cf.AAC.24